MADPARTWLFLLGGFLISFLNCGFLAALQRVDTEKKGRSARGFSDKAAGAVLLSLVGGFLCWLGISALGFSFAPSLGLFCLFLCFGVFFPFTLGYAFFGAYYRATNKILGTLTKIVGSTAGLLLSLPSLLLVKAAGPSAASDLTEEDVLSAVDTAEEQDFIDESQKEMIANIFELDDVTAGDAMTHRTDVEAVEESTPVLEVIHLSAEAGVSRLPVYRRSLDDVVGIVHVKDLFALVDDESLRAKTAGDFMRSAMFVPEACRARELLLEFKKKHTQIAIVVDEYGGTSGLVTMEDVLEEIVGDMQDEFDDEEEPFVPVENGGYLCDGSADLEDVFDLFSLPVPEEFEEEDFESVGGLMIEKLGRIPTEGEHPEIDYGGLHFKVLQTEERRILKVLCTPAVSLGGADETL